MFNPTWGNDPNWRLRIFFTWVETQPPGSKKESTSITTSNNLSPRYTKVTGVTFQRYAELELAMILFTLGFSNDPLGNDDISPHPSKKRHFLSRLLFRILLTSRLLAWWVRCFLGEPWRVTKSDIDDNSEVSTSSMALVLRKPLIVSSQPLWRPSGLEKGWRWWIPVVDIWRMGPHLGDVVIGSIPHLFQPFLFGHLEGCPTTRILRGRSNDHHGY